jgi:hypothetical protein
MCAYAENPQEEKNKQKIEVILEKKSTNPFKPLLFISKSGCRAFRCICCNPICNIFSLGFYEC